MSVKDQTQTQDEALLQAIFSLGVNFLAQGKYEKAAVIFDGLMAINAANRNYAFAYGETLLMMGQNAKAFDHFTTTIKQYGYDEASCLGAAKAAILLGRYDQAKEFLQQLSDGEVDSCAQVKRLAKSMQEINENLPP